MFLDSIFASFDFIAESYQSAEIFFENSALREHHITGKSVSNLGHAGVLVKQLIFIQNWKKKQNRN